MARKYALVPESWLTARYENHDTTKNSSDIEIADPKIEHSFAQMVELLPKNLRNRAKIMLHYLEGKITLNEHERVQYSDGAIGSHLLDLVRYYVSPLAKARPVDAPKFEAVMQSIGVPASAYVQKKVQTDQSNSLIAQWHPYK
jgi:hypothetical protein